MEVTSKKAKCDQSDPGGHISKNPTPYTRAKLVETECLVSHGSIKTTLVFCLAFVCFSYCFYFLQAQQAMSTASILYIFNIDYIVSIANV